MTGKATLPGGYRVEVDGKTYTLVVNLNVMALLEEHTGKNPFDPDFFIKFPSTPTEKRLFLWAMLTQEIPDITLEDAGKLLHAGSAAAVTAAMNEALIGSLPEPEKDTSAKGDKEKKKVIKKPSRPRSRKSSP